MGALCAKIKSIPRTKSFLPCLAICTSIAALVLTSLSAFACWFVSVDLTLALPGGENSNPLLPPELAATALSKYQSFGFGLWSRENANLQTSVCVLYSNNEKQYFFDAYWRTSRAMSMLAAIVGLFCLVATILHACTREPVVNRNLLPGYCVTALLQALAFVAYGSNLCRDNNGAACTFGRGSTMGAVAAFLFVVTGMFHFGIYKQVVKEEQDEKNNVAADDNVKMEGPNEEDLHEDEQEAIKAEQEQPEQEGVAENVADSTAETSPTTELQDVEVGTEATT